MKKCSTALIVKEMEMKAIMISIIHITLSIIKNWVIPIVGEDTERQAISYIDSWTVN